MSDSPSSFASRPPTALVGQMAGEYRLGRVLGEGGFGTVYEAEHPVLKRRAAVKVLQRVWAASGGQCGKYLAASMRIQLDGLERYGELVPGKDQVRRLGARRAAGDERGHDRPVSGAGAGQGRDHGQVHDEVVAAGVSYR